MKFKSTRGAEADSFSKAFNQGLAPDGGLFVPEYFPNIASKLDFYATLSYADLVSEFMFLFADEIPKEEWKGMAEKGYAEFDAADKIKIRHIANSMGISGSADHGDISILELFHGPTLAFKDFALQMVGQLYERECAKFGKRYTILGATSGDTGSAAIYGVLKNKDVRIFIMYPDGKIAPEQELQITTTGSDRVFPIAIKGSFDDAQSIVKEVFSDTDFAVEIGLAAVNSINIARILVQSVYYLFTYLKLRSEQSNQTAQDTQNGKDVVAKRIRFIVPTGNFGNILSGWFLNSMGLDCDFVLATNENDVLHELWQTGEYKKKDAKVTHAPSMDIQQASNFERLLYFMYDKDPLRVVETLNELREKGSVKIDTDLLPKSIASVSTSDVEIEEVIKKFYGEYEYVLDPHTACAYKGIFVNSLKSIDLSSPCASPVRYHNVILATASPAKFPEIIEKCTGMVPKDDRIEILRSREKIFVKMNADIEEVKKYIKSSLGI